MDLLPILELNLPALAWAAERERRGGAVVLRFGSAVEPDADGLVAGAWAGRFAERGMASASTSIGTGLRRVGARLLGLVGTATVTPIHVLRTGDRLVLANSLSLALAVGEDELLPHYAFYPQDLYTFALGSDRYRRTIPTRRGRLGVYYASVEVDAAGRVRAMAPPDPPTFDDFASYRAMLVGEIAAVLANAADPARRRRYQPIVSLSAGYDSPAAAVLAKEAGCADAITFPQPVDQRESDEDGGAEIGKRLGLAVTTRPTFGYRRRSDLPEAEFLAASCGGGQVYLAGTESLLAGRVVISGGGGDTIWHREFGLHRRPHFPHYLGGYSATDFYLRLPAFDLSVPAIASTRWAEIGRLSRSAEMRPWSLGGTYDRPIARRILEEAGLPRGSFAERKRQITPVYDSASRRSPPIDAMLSATSAGEFHRWFAARAPLRPLAARCHRLLVDTVGRIVWSGKFHRLLWRFGASWPPFPARFWHLRVPMRLNAFVFNWAVERQLAFYRRALRRSEAVAAAAPGSGAPASAAAETVTPVPRPKIAIPSRFAPAGRVAALRLAPKVTLRRLGKDEGGVMLRLADGQLYTCNDTTVAFLEAIDGCRDLSAIVDRACGMFDATREQVTFDFVELAERLLAENLIQIDDDIAA
jgi:hypothetical protein